MNLIATFAFAGLALAGAAATQVPPPAASSVPVVSGDARAAVSPEMRAARRAVLQTCAADTAKFCAETPAAAAKTGERPRPMQCLRQHRAELSTDCAQAITSFRKARKAES